MAITKKTTEEKQDKVEKTARASMKELYGGSQTGDKKEGATKSGNYREAYRILVKPLLTEKATVAGSLNKYYFAVSRDANKIEVAKSVEQVYGVKPTSVNMVNMKGKDVRYGRRAGRRKDWKKAVVTLPAGKSIKVYEGI